MTDATTQAVARVTPPRRERDVQREILRLLHAHGIVAFGMNRERAGKRRANHIGVKGMPDIWGWWPGVPEIFSMRFACAVLIEVKKPGGKLRPEQAAFLAKARKDGCIAFMATSPADVARELGWP